MNYARLALAAVAATVFDACYGFLVYGMALAPEFARYPGGAHTMLRVGPPSHRADFLERVLGWFTDHLGGPLP